MRILSLIVAVAATSILISACDRSTTEPEPTASEPVDQEKMNVVLQEWTGPYGGVPPFDRIELEDLKPALEMAMARHLAELDVIANQAAPPTFENTILAMEAAGQDMNRVMPVWGIYSSNLSTPEFREVEQEMAPKLAEYYSAINQNTRLFERVRAIYEGEEFAQLRSDQQRLVWQIYDGFASNGATLEGVEKERYAAINQQLAELQTQFSSRVLADEEGYVTLLNEDQLGGLPDSVIAAAAQAAADNGQAGQWAITNTRSSMDPFLTYSDERDLREIVWRNYYSRGNNGDENDTNALISEILALRDERAELLGYNNFAEWQMQNRMAKTPQAALDLMEAVWPYAIARVEEEVADMQAIADEEGADIIIQPWDYRYYAEKVRQARY
ncbi:MAG TPA: M3 family metallopeptidase, partial [Xanthomonadales bacterium]|nr:M3 family metallopeptidase [Xanthomonadales bacterium]